MRNNTRGLLFHMMTVLVVFLLALLINSSETLRNIIYGNIFFRLLLTIIPLVLYYTFGRGMSSKNARQLDFLSGNIIVLLSILFYILAFLGLGKKVFSLPVGASLWKFPLEIFLMPQIYVLKIHGLPVNTLSLLIGSLIPGLVYGIRIKKSRIQRQKKMKIRRHQQQLRQKGRRR